MNKEKLLLLEKKIKKLEQAVEQTEDLSTVDDTLHDELIDELNAFIRQCNAKLKSELGNPDTNKMVRKTKSFKLIKSLKDAWIYSAKK